MRTILVSTILLLVQDSASAETGRVTNGATGKPIVGAHVVAIWDAEAFHGSECFNVAAAQTDAAGQFHLPVWSWNINPLYTRRQRKLLTYYPGYRTPDFVWRDDQREIVMEVDPRTGNERLMYIAKLLYGCNCGSIAQRASELLPIYRAVLKESMSLAESKLERQIVSNIMFSIDRLEIGEVSAEANSKARAIEWGLK